MLNKFPSLRKYTSHTCNKISATCQMGAGVLLGIGSVAATKSAYDSEYSSTYKALSLLAFCGGVLTFLGGATRYLAASIAEEDARAKKADVPCTSVIVRSNLANPHKSIEPIALKRSNSAGSLSQHYQPKDLVPARQFSTRVEQYVDSKSMSMVI